MSGCEYCGAGKCGCGWKAINPIETAAVAFDKIEFRQDVSFAFAELDDREFTDLVARCNNASDDSDGFWRQMLVESENYNRLTQRRIQELVSKIIPSSW